MRPAGSGKHSRHRLYCPDMHAALLDGVADWIEEKERSIMPTDERARSTICGTEYLQCYDQHDEFGQVDGRIIVELGADGSVVKAKYAKGGAPKKVKRCIEDLIGKAQVDGYDGGKARVQCEYAGTYHRGTQMMSYSSGYEAITD